MSKQKRITIGAYADEKPLALDIESLLESKLLIQANSGGGKSNTIRIIAEQLSPHVPCVILDREGEFATLREKVDLVLVGEGGELNTSIKNAGELALKLLGLGVSAVIDLYGLTLTEQRMYVERFCENLLAAPKHLYRPFALFIDEADLFCPEPGRRSGHVASHDAVVRLMSLSRKRGICAIMATQRLASLATDARAPINNFLIGRATLDVDYRRAGEILGLPKQQQSAMARLSKGDFYAYGPAMPHDGVVLAHVHKAQTPPPKLHAGKTSKPPAPSDAIKSLVPELSALAEAKNENDVATIDEARKRINELQREINKVKSSPPPPPPGPPQTVIDEDAINRAVATCNAHWLEVCRQRVGQLESAIGVLSAARLQLQEFIAEGGKRGAALSQRSGPGHSRKQGVSVSAANKTPHRHGGIHHGTPGTGGHRQPAPLQTSRSASGGLGKAEQAILNSIAWWDSMGERDPGRDRIAIIAGYHPRTKGFLNAIGALRSAGLVDGEKLTAAGVAAAVAPSSPPTLAQVHQMLKEQLSGSQGKLFDAIVRAGGGLTRDGLAESVPCHPRTKGFLNDLGRMRTLGIIDYGKNGEVTGTSLMYPKGVL